MKYRYQSNVRGALLLNSDRANNYINVFIVTVEVVNVRQYNNSLLQVHAQSIVVVYTRNATAEYVNRMS